MSGIERRAYKPRQSTLASLQHKMATARSIEMDQPTKMVPTRGLITHSQEICFGRYKLEGPHSLVHDCDSCS